MKENSKIISTMLHVSSCVHMATGEGRNDVQDLASCFMQSALWEVPGCSLQGLCTVLDEHISFTSDLGTDSGIRALRVRDPGELLPFVG